MHCTHDREESIETSAEDGGMACWVICSPFCASPVILIVQLGPVSVEGSLSVMMVASAAIVGIR